MTPFVSFASLILTQTDVAVRRGAASLDGSIYIQCASSALSLI